RENAWNASPAVVVTCSVNNAGGFHEALVDGHCSGLAAWNRVRGRNEPNATRRLHDSGAVLQSVLRALLLPISRLLRVLSQQLPGGSRLRPPRQLGLRLVVRSAARLSPRPIS